MKSLLCRDRGFVYGFVAIGRKNSAWIQAKCRIDGEKQGHERKTALDKSMFLCYNNMTFYKTKPEYGRGYLYP